MGYNVAFTARNNGRAGGQNTKNTFRQCHLWVDPKKIADVESTYTFM